MSKQYRIEFDTTARTVTLILENGTPMVQLIEHIPAGQRVRSVALAMRKAMRVMADASVVVWDEKAGDFVGRDHHV